MPLTLSPNMSLPIPSVGLEAGPEYADDINNSLSLIDSHNHAAGQGVQIDPTGININADLPLNSNNLTEIRTLRLESQNAALSLPTDLGCLYEVDDDLYFNDGLGNQIRLTQNGTIAAAAGNIANLVAPASASFVDLTDTFIWQSGTNIAANMDMGSIILRKLTASSPGITIAPPVALASDYTVTMMAAAPAATAFLAMDSSGNISAPANTTGGITLAMLTAAVQASLNPAGTILMTGRATAPTGYLLCDGSSVLRADYPALFTAISTAFGAADGTHFNLPDMRGRFPRGVTGASSQDPDTASRTAMATGGNTGNNVGSVQGHALQTHNHGSTKNAFLVQDLSTPTYTLAFGADLPGNNPAADALVGAAGPTAQSTANETRPVNAYVNFIIKT